MHELGIGAHPQYLCIAVFEIGVEIAESLEFIEWLGEIKMLRLLNEQKLALDGARVK